MEISPARVSIVHYSTVALYCAGSSILSQSEESASGIGYCEDCETAGEDYETACLLAGTYSCDVAATSPAPGRTATA